MRFIFIAVIFFFLIVGTYVNYSEDKMPELEVATFAGGCFWCIEAPFQETKGVTSAISGYSGGKEENPTYEEVTSGKTGHLEAVEIIYDTSKISYEELLDIYWRQIDPTDDGGQFADRGAQYKTAIFYHNEEQKKSAEKSKKELDDSGKFDKPIVTKIIPFLNFYMAEEYHQDYYKKRIFQYNAYKKGSGRTDYIEETWGEGK